MDPTTTLITWAVLALAACMSPGPDTLLVVGHAARNGRTAGLLATAGIVAGGIWYMVLCGFGLLGLLALSPLLFTIVKTAGAVYLGYLGLALLRSAVLPRPAEAMDSVKTDKAPFRQAFVTNALNPKVALFYIAVLPQFTGSGPSAPLIGMLLIAVHYLIAGAWYSAVVAATCSARRFAPRKQIVRIIEGALGIGFVALAGKLALERN